MSGSIRAFVVRLWAFFRGQPADSDFDSELESHLQLHIGDNLRAGMDPAQARRQAVLKLGGIEKTKEDHRDRRSLPFLETLFRDVRYGCRQIGRNPGFTAVVVLTLALGIGVNTAVFSVVNAVALRDLPYPRSDRLYVASLTNPANASTHTAYGAVDFLAAKELQRSFDALAGVSWSDAFTWSGGSEPERVQGSAVTADFFRVVGVYPAIGRAFAPGDDLPGRPREVVLSHRFWERRLGADPQAVGRTVTLDGAPYVVVGIMPPDFHFAAFGATDDTDLWPLLPLEPRNVRYPFSLRVVGRLAPGVTDSQARADLSVIASQVQRRFPETDLSSVFLESLKTRITGEVRPALLLLLAAVSLVQLIATVNVANLTIARATARDREMAIRASLGAGRGRVARQVLTEALLLAAIGGAAGLLVAFGGVWFLRVIAPSGIPRLAEAAVDGQALAFTAAVSLLSGLVFGTAPVIQGFGRRLDETLRGGAQDLAQQHRRQGLRKTLIVVEVALSVALSIDAGLLLRSFERLSSTSPGFNPRPLLTALISLPEARYPNGARIGSFYDRLLDRARSLPAVSSAAVSMSLPPDQVNLWNPFRVPSEPLAPGKTFPVAVEMTISPDYFRTLGVPFLRGRDFGNADRGRRDGVLIVNDTLARRYFPGQDPVGQKIQTGSPTAVSPWETIVGVVADVKYSGLRAPADPTLYVPLFQPGWASLSREMFLVVRTAGNPEDLGPGLRTTVRDLDRDIPLAHVQTMPALLADSVSQPRFRTLLLGIFAGLALLLSAIGIFGVMAWLVNRRQREIGVRMAMGASRSAVLRMVLSEGMRVALVGIALGLLVALASGRLLGSLLFGLGPADPVTYGMVSLVAALVALAACYIPAARATRVDPMAALRFE